MMNDYEHRSTYYVAYYREKSSQGPARATHNFSPPMAPSALKLSGPWEGMEGGFHASFSVQCTLG